MRCNPHRVWVTAGVLIILTLAIVNSIKWSALR